MELEFVSTFPCSTPDVELYAGLKHIHPIRLQLADELLPFNGVTIPELVLSLVGEELAPAWMTYACNRLVAAALNHQGRQQLPSPFPGRFLPGGGGCGPVDRGCLQIHWARHALEMEQPVEGVELLRRRLNGSGLEVLSLPKITRSGTWEERLLREEVRDLLGAGTLAPALAWVDSLWSPGQPFPPLRRALVELAGDLTKITPKLLKSLGMSTSVDPFALLLEVHDIVHRLEAHATLGIERVGIGVWNGVWCEVGLAPLTAIRATELVQTPRAIQELETLHLRGFAPIVLNERGCNIDGSHRHVAFEIWNALCSAKGRRALDIAEAVPDFTARHSDEMGELLTHEVNRVFHEAWMNPVLRTIIERACAEARPDRRVTRVPVILVPEPSAGTVIKSLYDDETKKRSVRVCSSVYAMLARDAHLTLQERGPYHRTDAFPLPWFQVVPE